MRAFLSFYKNFDELLMHFCKILLQTIYNLQLVDTNFQNTSVLSTHYTKVWNKNIFLN